MGKGLFGLFAGAALLAIISAWSQVAAAGPGIPRNAIDASENTVARVHYYGSRRHYGPHYRRPRVHGHYPPPAYYAPPRNYGYYAPPAYYPPPAVYYPPPVVYYPAPVVTYPYAPVAPPYRYDDAPYPRYYHSHYGW